MSIIDISVPDRTDSSKKVILKRYAIEPKEEPTAVIFGKFSPFTGPNGHGRLIEFAKKQGIHKIAFVSPERKDQNASGKYGAEIFTPTQRIDIVKKAVKKFSGISNPIIFNITSTNPLGMFREISTKIDRPVIIVGPDRAVEFGKFFIPYNKNNKSILDVTDSKFGKGEMLSMKDRGDDETSGTEVRKSLVDGDYHNFHKMTGYDNHFYDYLRDLLKHNKIIKESFDIGISFKQFYLMSEGGNVRLPLSNNSYIEAEKLDLTKLDETDFEVIKTALLNAFKEMNYSFEKFYGKPFWKDFHNLTKNAKVFSGSTRTFFIKPFKEYSEFKKSVGDIDLQVPEELMPKIKEWLDKNKDKKFGEFIWKGYTANGLQYNGLLELPKQWHSIIKYFQVDFEGTSFNNHEPTEFAKFGHYSSWTDIKKSIKGLFVKFLIRGLVSAIKTKNVTIIGKNGKPLKREPLQSFFGFSVDKGLRSKIEPVIDDLGNVVITNGLPTYKEIPSISANYSQSLNDIYAMIFNEKPTQTEKESLFSFVKTLQLMKKKLDNNKVEIAFDNFIGNLWGSGSQGIERNNSDADNEIKTAAYKEFVSVFPFLNSKRNQIEKLKTEYYKHYRMT